MIRIAALLFLLVLAPVSSAQGAPQAAEPTARQAMARVIADAMVPTSRNNYGRDWDALSVRISRYLHWHLAPPDQAADITSATGIRRNGWIEDGTEQIGVAAYGFETVDTLTFALSPKFATSEPDEDDTIIAALTAI